MHLFIREKHYPKQGALSALLAPGTFRTAVAREAEVKHHGTAHCLDRGWGLGMRSRAFLSTHLCLDRKKEPKPGRTGG